MSGEEVSMSFRINPVAKPTSLRPVPVIMHTTFLPSRQTSLLRLVNNPATAAAEAGSQNIPSSIPMRSRREASSRTSLVSQDSPEMHYDAGIQKIEQAC